MESNGNYLLYKKFASERSLNFLESAIKEKGYPPNDTLGEFSLLTIAIHFSDIKLIRFLMELGYSTDLQFSDGSSVFHEALEIDDIDVARKVYKVLLEYGSPGGEIDANGCTAADLMSSRGITI